MIIDSENLEDINNKIKTLRLNNKIKKLLVFKIRIYKEKMKNNVDPNQGT